MGTRAIWELAREVRSKNAGPFLVSLDVMFRKSGDYRKGKRVMTASAVAKLYGVPTSQVVKISHCDPGLAIKVTMLRKKSSGSVDDTDVYGCQQHVPLLGMRI